MCEPGIDAQPEIAGVHRVRVTEIVPPSKPEAYSGSEPVVLLAYADAESRHRRSHCQRGERQNHRRDLGKRESPPPGKGWITAGCRAARRRPGCWRRRLADICRPAHAGRSEPQT